MSNGKKELVIGCVQVRNQTKKMKSGRKEISIVGMDVLSSALKPMNQGGKRDEQR